MALLPQFLLDPTQLNRNNYNNERRETIRTIKNKKGTI